MSDQVKATVKNRRWPRRLLWSAILAFVALQVHSYYYLRFMVMYPFSAAYEPQMSPDPAASKRADGRIGLITPMFESVTVARMHWASLSQNPPQFKGLTLVKGRELENKIFGFLANKSRPGYQSSIKYKKSQFYESYLATAYASTNYGFFAFFDDKVCVSIWNGAIFCNSVYQKFGKSYIYYSISGRNFLDDEIIKWGDVK
ncbi:MAG: hypothetical protein ABIM50_05525 [Novosphingobium sp.]